MGEAPALWPYGRGLSRTRACLGISVPGLGVVLSSGLNLGKAGGAWSELHFG